MASANFSHTRGTPKNNVGRAAFKVSFNEPTKEKIGFLKNGNFFFLKKKIKRNEYL